MAVYGSNYDYGDSPFYKDEGWDDTTGLFYFLPNWKFAVSLSYLFKTIISETRTKIEQRKALLPKPIRKESFTVTENDTYEEVWNYLIQLHASDLYLPIYTEPCKPSGSGSLIGLFDIPVNDVWYHYNLRNFTTFVLVIDLREIITAEVHFLGAAVTANLITLADAIIGDFQEKTTIIYPLLHCYLSSKERKELTDKMTQFNLEFTEYEIYA
jgi:hypothetical protein